MTTLLIDGDQFLYRATSALETEVQWDDQNHVLFCNAEAAWDVFSDSIEKLKTHFSANRAYIAFGGEGNFRRDLYPSYKAKRGRKPLCYGRLYERAHNEYKCHHVDGLEGDDLLGIWATSGRFGETIIISDDKDMQTVPSTIYRNGELVHVTEEAADYFWMFQTLTGDTSDGYPGCPGIGKVKAEKILHEALDGLGSMRLGPNITYMWMEVVKTFEAAGLTKDDALTQARVSRILRSSDWDSERKEVKLWEP